MKGFLPLFATYSSTIGACMFCMSAWVARPLGLWRMRSVSDLPLSSVGCRPSRCPQPTWDQLLAGKQPNDRLVILRTWSWSRRGSERQALSCWDFCLGETCDSEVFGCSYGFTRWRPAYALGGAQMTISDSGNCYFSTKAFKVVHITVRRSG